MGFSAKRRVNLTVQYRTGCVYGSDWSFNAPPAQEKEPAPASLHLELNRLEQNGAACRATLIAKNGFEAGLDETGFELVMFDKAGLISLMTVFDFGMLPAGKTIGSALRSAANRLQRADTPFSSTACRVALAKGSTSPGARQISPLQIGPRSNSAAETRRAPQMPSTSTIISTIGGFLELGGPVVSILLAVSIMSLAVILFETLSVFTRGRGLPQAIRTGRFSLYAAGRVREAHDLAAQGRNPAAETVAQAISLVMANRLDKHAMEERIARLATAPTARTPIRVPLFS